MPDVSMTYDKYILLNKIKDTTSADHFLIKSLIYKKIMNEIYNDLPLDVNDNLYRYYIDYSLNSYLYMDEIKIDKNKNRNFKMFFKK